MSTAGRVRDQTASQVREQPAYVVPPVLDGLSWHGH